MMYDAKPNRPPIFIMMVGLPGSGKSTIVKELQETNDFVVISTDNFIELVAQREGKTYNEVFKDNIKMAEDVMKTTLDFALSARKNIIWDQTNLSVKTRANKLAKVPKEYYKKAIITQATDDVLLQVNSERAKYGRSIPDSIFANMLKTYESPTTAEGFTCIQWHRRGQ